MFIMFIIVCIMKYPLWPPDLLNQLPSVWIVCVSLVPGHDIWVDPNRPGWMVDRWVRSVLMKAYPLHILHIPCDSRNAFQRVCS